MKMEVEKKDIGKKSEEDDCEEKNSEELEIN